MSPIQPTNNIREQVRSTTLPEDAIAVWSLGQEGFLVKWNDKTVLFDPYLSNWVYELAGEPWQRAFESPLQPSDCRAVD
ncbi:MULTISPECIES: MBL fold metallo-hydrolase [Paenibacillus]|uniref:MBL fold metallo-hydrolase n=1 Tax=Paenibacillus TaxID=44249 RepID=UPI0002DD8BEC|nr:MULTISPECIES: MBL fold metallo-hydrolase [unclassified Paenibacillus]OXL87553.1 hypothetical protein BCV73_34225 [Paenibacillus sp. SSG-1]